MIVKMGNKTLLLMAIMLSCSFAHADIMTGTRQGNAEAVIWAPSWGDPNGVIFAVSDNDITDLWIYGSSGWGGGVNDWGIATGVTNVGQITDASIYPLNSGNGFFQLGDFAVARGSTGYWAVLTITNISYDPVGQHYNAGLQWWYQDNGTADFSSVPEPSFFLLLFIALGAVGLIAWRRGKLASSLRL